MEKSKRKRTCRTIRKKVSVNATRTSKKGITTKEVVVRIKLNGNVEAKSKKK